MHKCTGILLVILVGFTENRPLKPIIPPPGSNTTRDLIKKCYCPVGHQPVSNCSAERAVVCEECPRGSYSNEYGVKPCKPCQPCTGHTHQVTPCTPSSEAICVDILRLSMVCEEIRPAVLHDDDDGIQKDVIMGVHKKSDPSNEELAIVILCLFAVALVGVLLWLIRGKESRKRSDRAVENADFFHKSGSIYQDEVQTPTNQPLRSGSAIDFLGHFLARLGLRAPVENPVRRSSAVQLSNRSRKAEKFRSPSSSTYETYCPPSSRKFKSPLDANGFYKDEFDSEGGTLAHNEVAVTICKLSIPQGQVYTIRGKTHTRILEWHPYIDVGEVIIAPPLELHVDGGHVFDNHVTVCIPHCITDLYSLAAVRVFWGDKANGSLFQPIPRMSEKHRDSEAFYVADEDHIYIHAKHFNSSQFVCTISGSQISLSLQIMVFYEHHVVANMQYLTLKVTLCDSRNTIPELRMAYFEQEGLPHVESCSWKPLELPLGYATPNTEVLVELVLDDDNSWEETTFGEMKIPLRLNKKLIDVLNLTSNCLAEFKLKRPFVGKPAERFHGTLILGSSERIEEQRCNEVTCVSAGGVIRRDRLRGRGVSTYTIETKKSSKEELPVLIQLDSNSVSPSKYINGNIQDGIAFVAQNLLSTDFNKFYRQLGLKEVDIDDIKERCKDDLYEQKMQMLLLWQQRLGKMATTSALIHAMREIGLSKTADDLEVDILNKIK